MTGNIETSVSKPFGRSAGAAGGGGAVSGGVAGGGGAVSGGAPEGGGAWGGVPLDGGGSDRRNSFGARAGRPRSAGRRSPMASAAVALAGVLALLASVLALVAPTASPASAQAATYYDMAEVFVGNMNHADTMGANHGVSWDASRVVPPRENPDQVELFYTIRPQAASPMGCTAEKTYSLVMEGSSAESLQDKDDPNLRLVLTPMGTSAQCSYDVEWLPSYDATSNSWYGPHPHQHNVPGKNTITPGDRVSQSFSASYEKIITYRPDVTVTLPPRIIGVLEDTTLVGETIEVEVANSDSDCGGKVTLVVNSNGMAELSDDSALWDLPAGERDNHCGDYTLTFPDNNGSLLAKVAGTTEDVDVSMTDTAASSAYERGESVFDADFEATGLPSGSTFEVVVTPLGADAAGAHPICINRFTVTLTWDSTAMKHLGSKADLIDYPARADMMSQVCTYMVAWPDVTGHGLIRSIARFARLDAGEPIDADYSAPTYYSAVIIEAFNMNIAGNMAAAHLVSWDADRVVPDGVTIPYTFTPKPGSPEGCTEARYTGTMTGSGVQKQQNEGDIDQVVLSPSGTNAECSYDVEFHPTYHAGSSSWYGPHTKQFNIPGKLEITPGSRDDRSTSISYEKILTYAPTDVTATLPSPLELPGRSDTTLVGEMIELGVEKVASESVNNCGGSVTLVVGAGGTVSPSPDSALWRQPAGERTDCGAGYTLTFPADNGGKLVKAAGATEDTGVTPTDTSATSEYERAAANFDMNFKVGVVRESSDVNSGTLEITVTPAGADSAGAHATCTDRFTETLTWDAGESRFTGSKTGVVDYLRGASAASDICQYNIGWPLVPGYERNTGLATADGGTPTLQALYRSNNFEQVQVQMHNMNNMGNSGGAHAVTFDATRVVPEGAVLQYRISPRADAGDLMSGCTEAQTFSSTTPAGNVRVIVGNHNAGDSNRELARRTDGAAAGQYCTYEVEFLPSSHAVSGVTSWYGSHTKQENVDQDLLIENGGNDAKTSYEKILDFQPEISLTLPADIIPGRADTTIVGETIEVAYARASSNTVANCGGARSELVATVGAGGAVSLSADSVLWDQPAGERDSCEYTLTFPADNGGKLAKVAGATEDTSTSDAAKDASSVYERVQGTFELTLEAEGLSSGSRLDVTVTAVEADAAGAHATCSNRFTETLTWDAAASKHTASNADVIDYPRGATAASDLCSYVIAWPAEVPGFELDSTTAADTMASQGDATATATYTRLPGTTFTATITIQVPQVNRQGTSDNLFYHADAATRTFFLVDIARSGGPVSGCSQFDDLRFEIGQNGMVSPTAGPISLIDVPDQATDGCEYTVTFPDQLSSAASVMPPWTLGREDVVPPTLSAGNPMISTRYFEAASNFTPTVSFALSPALDGVASGESLYAGAEFTVGFAPVSGSNAACSSAVSYTFAVQTGGGVTPGRVVGPLVDVPLMQAARCSYDVTVGPATVNSASGSPLTWRLQQGAGATSSVSAGSEAVLVSYALDGDTTFELDEMIDVPQYNADGNPASNAFAGTQIAIDVARSSGPTSDCSAATTITYTVGANGRLTTTDDETLVDYPEGESTRCVYGLTWSDPATGGGANLALQSGASATASGADRDLTGEYQAPVSRFMPSVSGSVQLVDENGDGAHDLSGVTLEVGYAPVDGSDNGCSSAESETYAVGDDGALALAQPPVVAQAQTAVMLVDRPAGVDARCVYALSYPMEVSAAADPAAPAETPVTVPLAAGSVVQLTAIDALVLNFVLPPPPVSRIEPVPLMSVNRGVDRLPVRVVLNVPSGAFIMGDAFEVLVWVPGACGFDTFLFGGVPASAGVAYAAPAGDGAQVVALGEGASQVNSRAAYSLPPYVDGAGGREACAVRVSVLSTPSGCSLNGAVGTDELGRSYVEAVWSQGSVGFDLTASFSCAGVVVQGDQGSVSLERGWVALPFNGESGTSPATFARSLNGAVSSLWVWDTDTQSWSGWTAQHGEVGLSSLSRGDAVMMFVPAAATVSYSPADLLDPPAAAADRLSVAPGYSLHTFGGDGPSRLSSLVSQPSPVAVVFLWHAETQSWRYNLPGRGPVASLDIDWFNTLSPGDTVFIYNQSDQATTIGWS